MQIKEIFEKPIDRNIQGVIKVGQETDANTKQELDEYVVTRELQENFADFFTAYERSLDGPTDDMGVWISGFFGSGKSHFLKILSYVLENRIVDGKPAIDYFQNKITDQMTLNQMQRAANTPTDVILFNIDSKSKTGAKHEDNAIINVFLQVFNEMQGFSDKDNWIAALERRLCDSGKYDVFKEKFAEIDGKMNWETGRDHYAFKLSTIKQALIASDSLKADDAEGFIKQIGHPYSFSIEDFAKLVNDYISKTGRRVIFLVDEVGQFVGESVQRMLNLQTVVEELGFATQGKAWVVVTSQQAIDQVSDQRINGQDFSKIQGRFKTRINMSSANVDEVIRKRILTKNHIAQRELENEYIDKSATINNMIDFDDGVTRKNYTSAMDFANNYPFLPYQFNLLQDVLTAVRTHGSDGKHLSEGERSMLSIFQESAIASEERNIGGLIPFSLFYEGLDQFLDHTHRIVIQRTLDDDILNPNHEANPFDAQVLKVLFMVKYVDNFKATLHNVVTLMIDEIDIDRINLEKKVQNSLERLQKQGLIEKNIESFEFLTDTEQDVNQEIQKQEVTSADIIEEMGSFIFGGQKTALSDKYKYPKLNGRYVFTFNRFIDDTPIGKFDNELTLRIITPGSEYFNDEKALAAYSFQSSKDIFVVLPATETKYLEYIERAKKIKKFMLGRLNNTDSRFKKVVEQRGTDRQALLEQAHSNLNTAIDASTIYIDGKVIEGNGDLSTRLAEAEKKTVDNAYRNLEYINAAKSENDIFTLLKDDDAINLETDENSQALESVDQYIQKSTVVVDHTSPKTIISHFHRVPFGYIEEDTEWLIAKLFVAGRIKLRLNGEAVNRFDGRFSERTIVDLITKKQYNEKLAISPQKQVTEQDTHMMREFAKNVLDRSLTDSNPEQMISHLKAMAYTQLDSLKKYQNSNSRFPGQNALSDGIELLNRLLSNQESDDFISAIQKNNEELLKWRDQFDEKGISEFYKSQTQQDIWKQGLQDLDIYAKSRDLISDSGLEKTIDEITTLLHSNTVEGTVPHIKELHTVFNTQFSQILDAKNTEIQAQINATSDIALEQLAASSVETEFKNKLENQFKNQIARIKHEAEDSANLNDLIAKPVQAEAQVKNLRHQISIESEKLSQEQRNVSEQQDANMPSPVPTKLVKREAYIDLKELPISRPHKVTGEADLDAYLLEMKKQLLIKLQDVDELNISI
ncbi:BREX system P-loop protein BrxC [Oenococcus sp.]|uniref:BREX system P-loop protein BrxC n=1 Tax=Oenococcus sp. TaxID=1979414 RepID=UPI0039E825A0